MLDVNVLITAHRGEQRSHAEVLGYLDQLRYGDNAYAIPEIVLSAVVRILTGNAFKPSATTEEALNFIDAITAPQHCLRLRPTESHWELFQSLTRRTGARGKLVPDAYLAAMAIDQSFELITMDTDFARFPGLRWRHPLEPVGHTNPG